MGAGDVKLMAAIGSLTGASNWFWIFIFTNILGGLVAVALLLAKRRLGNTLANVGYMLKELAFFRPPYLKKDELDVKSPKAVTLPHGVMISLGSIAYLVIVAIWAPR
jgi:prepilin peptidase CpaA